MRKIFPLLLLFVIVVTGSTEVHAQAKRRPMPDWIWKKPQRSNTTFYYHVEKAVGETETEARNAAYTQAFMQVALKLGIPLNTEDISEAVQKGTNVRMLSQQFTIPMNVVCFFSRKEDIEGWSYWLLCQIPEVGYADHVRFDDFTDCYTHHRYDSISEARAQEAKDKERFSNARAIAASTFIPGLGQMLKKQGGSGAAFLLSELALFGGGTACYFLGQDQAKIMKTSKSYEEYSDAKKMKNTMDIAMYAAFGAGVAVHIGNMVHAWVVQDKHLTQNLTFAPAIIPTNEYSQPSYAYGAGVQIKF